MPARGLARVCAFRGKDSGKGLQLISRCIASQREGVPIAGGADTATLGPYLNGYLMAGSHSTILFAAVRC